MILIFRNWNLCFICLFEILSSLVILNFLLNQNLGLKRIGDFKKEKKVKNCPSLTVWEALCCRH